MDQIYLQTKAVIEELGEKANLKAGNIVVVGCSTSEVLGAKIGTNSNPDTAKKCHNTSEIRVVKKMREAGHNGLIVGASGCALCTPCAQTQGLPCNFPDLKYSCMSAYCVFVKKLADACEMEYDCGEGLLGLFGMYVFD